MFLRSMSFLIGILVLLFILTTMGFSENALANTCQSAFDTPEYATSYESFAEEVFYDAQSGRYIEGRPNNRFENYDEFGNSHSNEFYYNESF